MKNFIEKEFIKYYLGNTQIRTHVDAVHAVPPYADQFTGEIVMGLINKINCSGIISKVSRKKIDLNRRRDVNNKEAIDEYRNAIHSILTYLSLFEENNQILKQPYLHLAIHGMKDTHNKEIIIGTKVITIVAITPKSMFSLIINNSPEIIAKLADRKNLFNESKRLEWESDICT